MKDSQAYPNFDFSETESEAADLCEILDENSDLGIDDPLIDLAAGPNLTHKGILNQRNSSLSSLTISSNARVELVTVGTTVGATVTSYSRTYTL